MDIMESISRENLRLNSLVKVSIVSWNLSWLGIVPSWPYCPKLFSCEWFPLNYEPDSMSQWFSEFPITSDSSRSRRLVFSFPSITSILSKSDISLDFLAFAFCLLVECMRSCYQRKDVKYFLLVNQNFINSIEAKVFVLSSSGLGVPGIYTRLCMTYKM